jgi:hypothetical protein
LKSLLYLFFVNKKKHTLIFIGFLLVFVFSLFGAFLYEKISHIHSAKADMSLPLIDSSFFGRADLLYGSEIGSLKMQDNKYSGHFMLDYNNSCPSCVQLANDAKIPVVRWAVGDTFTDMKNPSGNNGSMQRSEFNYVIDGIRNTLNAYPFIKLQPITPSSSNNFCPESWGVPNLITMDKSIIKEAGNRVQLYEIANEMELDCGYTLENTGTKAGQYWVQVAPVLKKYARSLGFEIYMGGAAFMSSNINAGTDSWDLKKFQDFLQVIKNEYNNPSSPYYHDSDLIPSFVSFHAYGIEYVNNVGGGSTPLDGITHYGDLIDGIQSNINSIWGSLGQNIKIVCSEWNVGAETYDFPSPLSENYYTQFLQLLRDHNVFMANQFLMASNNNSMDMITESGQTTPYYLAFKNQSLNDSAANDSRLGITPTPTPTPALATPTPTPEADPPPKLSYYDNVAADNPNVFWRLGEVSGTTANNELSASHSGLYQNSPTLGLTGALNDDSNPAVDFNGSDQYMTATYSAALNTADFSFEAWVYPKGGSGTYRGILTDRFYPKGWVLYADGNNDFSFWINDGSSMPSLVGSTIPLNAWTYLAGTFDGSTARFYVNGSLAASQSIVSYTPNDTSPVIVGQGDLGSNFFFPGTIDEVGIYDRALSAVRILAHYNSGINGGPNTPDTIAPTTPEALSASALSETQIELSWVTSVDYTGVTYYDIYRNNSKIATSTVPTYTDNSVSESTLYTYYVIAHDAAGNTSHASNTFTVRTYGPQIISSSTTPSSDKDLDKK